MTTCSLVSEKQPNKARMSPEPQLTGLAKTFNSVTFTGRANVAKVCSQIIFLAFWDQNPFFNQATYASIILIVAAVKAKNYLKADK